MRFRAQETQQAQTQERPLNTGVPCEKQHAPGGIRTHTSHNGTSDFKSKAGDTVGVDGTVIARTPKGELAHGAAPGTFPIDYVTGTKRRGRPPKSAAPYVVDPATGCWIWQRAKNHRGYGLAWNGRRMVPAHVLMYENKHGPVPDGLQLDHECRRRDCVNPDHVEPVTPAENTRRGLLTKLSAEDVQAIRVAVTAGQTRKSVARRFGISDVQAGRIVRGLRWGSDSQALHRRPRRPGVER